MKLTASLLVADGEMRRYLPETLPALLEFCDEVRILDDGTQDGFSEWVEQWPGVFVTRAPTPTFYNHEGRARQRLLDWTLEGSPDWILAVDADELVADGLTLRRSCEVVDGHVDVMTLCLWEIWAVEPERIYIRQDGGWAEHDAAVVYAPQRLAQPLRIQDKALACGRVPESVRRAQSACVPTSLLHLGWARRAERVDRHHRYVLHDGGRFHQGSHLDSILWEDQRVRLSNTRWPPGLEPRRASLVDLANRP